MDVNEAALWVAVAAAVASALSSICSTIVSWFNRQRLKTVVDKVEEVHKATNSLVDKVVIEAKAASRAEGVEAGRAENSSALR